MPDLNKASIGNELKSMHIAVYALSLLGGAHKKVHTEDIATKCMEIAPDRFQWERYDYPDKERVRKALVHASEEKNGSLVAGRSGMEQRSKSRDGWQITPAGAEWLRSHESIFENAFTHSSGAAAPTIPRREAQRFLKTMRPLIPTAAVLIYGYGSGYRGMICTVLLSKSGVKVGFVGGAELAEPNRLLEGSGKKHKYIQLHTAADLSRAGIKQLIEAAYAAWQQRNS